MEEQKPVLENKQTQFNKKPVQKTKPKDVIQSIIVLVVIFLIGWFIYSVFFSSGGSKYSATIDTGSFNVVNPATLGVIFHVKNTGSKAGAPYCTINVSDANGNYSGTDGFTLKNIKPGQTVTSVDNITITKQGAQYVTTGSISCN